MSCTAPASAVCCSLMSMPGVVVALDGVGCDSCAPEVCGGRDLWAGMAASKTPTRKSAPNKVPALVMIWMAVLRADMTILPNHDT